jgi:hypothetical protein
METPPDGETTILRLIRKSDNNSCLQCTKPLCNFLGTKVTSVDAEISRGNFLIVSDLGINERAQNEYFCQKTA